MTDFVWNGVEVSAGRNHCGDLEYVVQDVVNVDGFLGSHVADFLEADTHRLIRETQTMPREIANLLTEVWDEDILEAATNALGMLEEPHL